MIFNSTTAIMNDVVIDSKINKEGVAVIEIKVYEDDRLKTVRQMVELYFTTQEDILNLVTELSNLSDMFYNYKKGLMEREKESKEICENCKACMEKLFDDENEVEWPESMKDEEIEYFADNQVVTEQYDEDGNVVNVKVEDVYDDKTEDTDE